MEGDFAEDDFDSADVAGNVDVPEGVCNIEHVGEPEKQFLRRFPRKQVGPYIRESQKGAAFYSKIFDLSLHSKHGKVVWDKLVVVDTNVAAGDGAEAAFARMSPTLLPSGCRVIDTEHANLWYVGSLLRRSGLGHQQVGRGFVNCDRDCTICFAA